MGEKNLLSILEFSRLTGIKRENLRFYDRIGLLSPERRGDNNYRYYSRHQLNTAYLIGNLRGLGVGIEDIKAYSATRTPESSLTLLAQQDEKIQKEIARLEETRLVMKLHAHMVSQALAHEKDALFLEEQEAQCLFLCPSIPSHMNPEEGGIFSYDYADAQGVNLGFPQGTLLPLAEAERAGEAATLQGQYYFKVGREGNAVKPAGLYAVAYGQGDPWAPSPLYRRLLDFIRARGYTPQGDLYEEYPVGDLSVLSAGLSQVRVEVQVRRRR